KQKKLIMLPSEIMIWQPEFTDKILSRKPGAVQYNPVNASRTLRAILSMYFFVADSNSTSFRRW
ncbi:hypothetical protein CWM38_22910, partial [Escherichia coli]